MTSDELIERATELRTVIDQKRHELQTFLDEYRRITTELRRRHTP